MKVICIDNKNPERPHLLHDADWIFEGETYHVVSEVMFENGLYYILKEKANPERPVYYNSKRFVPLSEAEVEEREKAELCY